MTPGDLERELRDSLARHAEQAPPPPPDPAAVPVRLGNRVRRRRAVAGSLAVVLATTTVTVGVVQFGQPPSTPRQAFIGVPPVDEPLNLPDGLVTASASPTPAPEPVMTTPVIRTPPVDLLVAGQLRSRSGERLDLPPAAEASRAYRIPGGWLAIGDRPGGRVSVWFLPNGAEPHAVLSNVEGVAVASDGRRLAWREAEGLVTGVLADGELTPSGRAPQPGVPVAFVGAAVLLRRPAPPPSTPALAPARPIGYDIWWPDGSHPSGGSAEVVGVYGALPDGRSIVAQVVDEDGRRCLALLDATDALSVTRRRCGLPLAGGSNGWVSPDGHWLVAEAAYQHAVMFDLTLVFGAGGAMHEAGPGPYGDVVWLDRRTLVHGSPGTHLVQVRLDWAAADRADAVRQVEVAGLPAGQQLRVVPRLGN